MGFQISPGVQVSEVDLTTIIPAVATTDGAYCGTFAWGPCDEIILVDSQSALVSRFHKPNSTNFEHWFTASNFLDYGNKLNVVRVVDVTSTGGANNAVATTSPIVGGTRILNRSSFDSQPTLTDRGEWVAKYPGALGNAIRVSICDSRPGAFANAESNFSANVVQGSRVVSFKASQNHNFQFLEGDTITFSFTADAPEADRLSTTSTNLPSGEYKVVDIDVNDEITVDRDFPVTVDNMIVGRKWEFYNVFDTIPGTSEYADDRDASLDEMHIAISDATGAISGTKGTILEVFANVSKASDAKNSDGTSNYYRDVINDQSQYVWWTAHASQPVDVSLEDIGSATTAGTPITFNQVAGIPSTELPLTRDLSQGSDGNSALPGPFQLGYDLFNNPEEIDVSLVLCGAHSGTVSRYVIDNVAESRKDCVAFLSPESTDCVNVANIDNALSSVRDYRTTTDGINGRSSSYAVMDSGWKYQYDKFNDVYRWTPLNADVAGLCVRTDSVRDPWFSPAGLNRGQVKNVVKLAWNPRRAHRDELYKNGINPVVTLPGQGTVLFGDKTLQSKPSAFDRINVRRLFIVLEKAIAASAKFTLFEFNDEFTRAQFRNLVEPFLRDVQGRRGIFDFKVVCDETNNTPEVIDRNEFVGDIYIKPARAINFITLNFVAARTGVDFDEIVGNF